MKDDPSWMTLDMVLAVHDAAIAQFGGMTGVRDKGLLESALGRPRHLFAYGSSDLHELAAAYAFGIAKNHPFIDGNKRTAFVVAGLFLQINGWRLTASEPQAAYATLGLADGTIAEEGYGRFLRDFSEHTPK
jgi:death on curing protein